jgi:hypothetical protein
MNNTSQEDSQARSRTFFAGISLKELFSTSEELHAFLIGFFEILCPWPPRIRIPSPSTGEGKGEGDNPNEAVLTEYHYYLAGRASGVIAWIAIAKLIQVVFW